MAKKYKNRIVDNITDLPVAPLNTQEDQLWQHLIDVVFNHVEDIKNFYPLEGLIFFSLYYNKDFTKEQHIAWGKYISAQLFTAKKAMQKQFFNNQGEVYTDKYGLLFMVLLPNIFKDNNSYFIIYEDGTITSTGLSFATDFYQNYGGDNISVHYPHKNLHREKNKTFWNFNGIDVHQITPTCKVFSCKENKKIGLMKNDIKSLSEILNMLNKKNTDGLFKWVEKAKFQKEKYHQLYR